MFINRFLKSYCQFKAFFYFLIMQLNTYKSNRKKGLIGIILFHLGYKKQHKFPLFLHKDPCQNINTDQTIKSNSENFIT